MHGLGKKKNWNIFSRQCKHSQSPRQWWQMRGGLQRRLKPDWSEPSWTGGPGGWRRLTDSARGCLPAYTSVCLSVSLDCIRLHPQSGRWHRDREREIGRKLEEPSGRQATPAVWQMSTGTNRQVWIFPEHSWAPAELQTVCFYGGLKVWILIHYTEKKQQMFGSAANLKLMAHLSFNAQCRSGHGE